MFAINHAASALIFRRQFKDKVAIIWLLVAVQLVEIMWVVLNLLGIEKIDTEEKVDFLGDIHL